MANVAGGRRTIVIVAIVATLTAVAGFLAAKLVVSPEDAAARTAAPAAGPITVPVEKKALNADIVTRGDIGYTGSTEVKLADGSAANAVVTGRVPEVGSEVTNASVLLEVTGRPVIALAGDLPTYRSLAVGSSGPDVEQLENALLAIGIDPGPLDKTYDAATGAAVAQLYTQIGYPAPLASEEATAAVTAAQAAVEEADKAVTAAQKALDDAAKGPSDSTRLQLQGAVDSAKAAYEQAKVTKSAPDPAKVAEASTKLAAAQEAKSLADQQLQAANERQAPDIAAYEQKAVEAAQAVTDAQLVLDAVNAGGPPRQADIDAAYNALQIAIAQRDEGLAVDTSSQQTALNEANAAAGTARTNLATAQAAVVTPLPAQEVVWLPAMPRRVDEILVQRGSVVSGALMRVSGADLSVKAKVGVQEASLLKPGLKATLTVPGVGTVDALVSEIQTGDSTGTPVILQPQNVTNEQAQAMRGVNVKVTIPVASTAGEVLVVPVAALFSDATGTPRVEILNADGTTRFQPVKLGLSTGGEVEVSPIDDRGASVQPSESTLTKGSLVVVGR